MSNGDYIDMRTDGDCFRCCVVAVLGLEYEDVPAFNEPDEEQWVGNLSRWCRGRGFSMVMVMPHRETVWSHFLSHGLWIAGGPGPRGVDHAVVYDGPQMLHDPHASREGLLKVTEAVVLFRVWRRDEDPLSLLGLSVRPANALYFAGLETVDEVEGMSDREILRLAHIGRKGLHEIRECIANHRASGDAARVEMKA